MGAGLMDAPAPPPRRRRDPMKQILRVRGSRAASPSCLTAEIRQTHQCPCHRPRQDQNCVKREVAGGEELVVRFREEEVLIVRPSGEIVLTSNGSTRAEVLTTLNQALGALDIKVKASDAGDWIVTDGGRFMKKFTDGMVIPPR